MSSANIDIIRYLARNADHDVFPQDVERRFGITRSTSCRVLGLMERKGLIVREPVPQDARLKKIVLTDKARHIDDELCEPTPWPWKNFFFKGLSDAEILGFMHVLDVMQTNLVSTGAIGNENRYSSLALHAEIVERITSRSQPTGKGTIVTATKEE